MTDQHKKEKANEWLEGIRIDNTWSYEYLGDTIGMTKSGIRKAIINKTLHFRKVLNIAKELGKENDLLSYLGENVSLVDEVNYSIEGVNDIDSFVKYLVENEDRLQKNHTFRLWLKNKVQEGVIKTLSKP